MAQQVFNQWLPVAKAQNEQGQEVYLPFAGIHMQTRDGNDEVIVGAGNMVWTGSMWVPVSAQNRLPVEATLSGQIVDSDENAVRVKTSALAWKSWDPFGATVFVPAGTYIDSPGDVMQVNGFGTLGLMLRRVDETRVGQVTVSVYWQSVPGPRENSRAVPESFEADSERAGLAMAVPTKSQYVGFRLYNRSETDATYHFHAMLRAS